MVESLPSKQMTRVRIPTGAFYRMENTSEQAQEKRKFSDFYNKHYKIILIIPFLIMIFCFFYLFSFYSNTGDFFYKDFSLTGGTSATIIGEIDANELKNSLYSVLEDINTREIYDIRTRAQIAVVVETTSDLETTRNVLEEYLGYNLDEDNSSFEFIGSALGEDFYKQMISAVFFAFLFMSLVVFILFRKIIPSAAVILAAFGDILMTLVVIDILGIKLSSAGIVAFLMLIGYSVDTDILLTNRVLKRTEGTLNEKLFGAFKTGIIMSLTALIAIAFALFVSKSFSPLLAQIFTILSIGIFFDILNTWVTNASLLKWYVETKEKHGK